MAALTAPGFLALTDKLAAAYLALLGSMATGNGLGTGDPNIANDWGYSSKIRSYQTLILAAQDPDQSTSLLPNVTRAVAQAPVSALASALLYPLMSDLARFCAKAKLPAVLDMATFAQYYNTSVGGAYNALVAPEFAALYAILYPGVAFPASGVYSPAVANLAQRSVGGAFLAGSVIDPAKYAGAATLTATVSASTFTSPGAITLTGTARASDGSIQTARTFTTGTVSGNGTVPLAASVAGDLLLSASSLTLPSGMTAGTIIVSGGVPAGRVSPPV